jgi:hypothetical protein
MDPSISRYQRTAEFHEDRNLTARLECEVTFGFRPWHSIVALAHVLSWRESPHTIVVDAESERVVRKRSWHIVTACDIPPVIYGCETSEQKRIADPTRRPIVQLARNSPYTGNVATFFRAPLRPSAGDGASLYRDELKERRAGLIRSLPPALVNDVRDS